MKKPTPFCIRALLMVLLFAVGCEHSDVDSHLGVDHAAGKAHTSPIEVTDRLNRTISLPHKPKRIVSLSPATTELMYAIGAGDLLVGATDHCNYPPAASKLARIGGGIANGISYEAIVSLSPDLILGKWDTHQTLLGTFERLNIPFMAIGPDSLSQLYDEATLLGKITGHGAEAMELIACMKSKVTTITTCVESIPSEQRRRVFYEVWDDPLMTAGPKSFLGELLEIGGMKNIFSDSSVGYPRVSSEVLLERDPEVILAPSSPADRVSCDILAKRAGWNRVTAVKNRQVFLIDGDKVSRCAPRMLDALEEMVRAVYPDKLPMIKTLEVAIH